MKSASLPQFKARKGTPAYTMVYSPIIRTNHIESLTIDSYMWIQTLVYLSSSNEEIWLAGLIFSTNLKFKHNFCNKSAVSISTGVP